MRINNLSLIKQRKRKAPQWKTHWKNAIILLSRLPSYVPGWLGVWSSGEVCQGTTVQRSIWYHVCFSNESSNEITKMNWTRLQKGVEFEIYIHSKPHHARLARPSSISSMPMLILLDPRACWAYQSRDMLARPSSTSSNMRVTISRVQPILACFLLARNIGFPLQTFVSKVWKMPLAKINNRTSSQRKQFLLSNFGLLSINMRPCKSCSFANKQYLLGDAFEKCLACVASRKSCDLVILPSTMRRVHKERVGVRNEVREAKAKLQRLKRQLERLKDEEENLILREWNTINCLKEKKSLNTFNFTFLLDVMSKQFQFSNLNWSPLVNDFIVVDLNESREMLVGNS